MRHLYSSFVLIGVFKIRDVCCAKHRLIWPYIIGVNAIIFPSSGVLMAYTVKWLDVLLLIFRIRFWNVNMLSEEK